MSHSEVNTDKSLNIGGHNTELVNNFVYLSSCIVDDKEWALTYPEETNTR
jgi:hypothetical protein